MIHKVQIGVTYIPSEICDLLRGCIDGLFFRTPPWLNRMLFAAPFVQRGELSIHLGKPFYIMELLSISKQILGLFYDFLFLLGEFQACFKQQQKKKTTKVCWVVVWFHSWEEE